MTEKITKLDDKYFILKIEDINKLDFKSQVQLGNIARKMEDGVKQSSLRICMKFRIVKI